MKVFKSIEEVKKQFLPKMWESERDPIEVIRERIGKKIRERLNEIFSSNFQ